MKLFRWTMEQLDKWVTLGLGCLIMLMSMGLVALIWGLALYFLKIVFFA